MRSEGLRPVFDAARKGLLDLLRPSPVKMLFRGGERQVIIESLEVNAPEPAFIKVAKKAKDKERY